ncbi:MAG: right-handed parallel beta-helix repeat-containing protein [Phycisphaerales bacterium]|nr:right-handed parallel beta-helix repeat-containing protein [Phycisphaerales bacterium]
MNRTATIVAGLSLAFVGTSTTYAATIHVPGEHALLQEAIDDAVDGDTIQIAAGHYVWSDITIQGKHLTIQGTNKNGVPGDGSASLTTINADHAHRIMLIGSTNSAHGALTNGTKIRDLILINGHTHANPDSNEINGGGIWVGHSDAHFYNVTVQDCKAWNYGGGIYILGGSPTIEYCHINHNESYGHAYAGGEARGGGIHCTGSASPTITDSFITNNKAYSDFTIGGLGGGIFCTATQGLLIEGCHITYNIARLGTAVYGDGSAEVHLEHCFLLPSLDVSAGCLPVEHTWWTCTLLHNADNCTAPNCPPITIEDSEICGEGDHIGGRVHFLTGNQIHDCLDAADVEQDGDVDIADLVAMRAALGLCKSDVDSDYDTDVMDLLWVIDGWGGICP